MTDSPVLPDPVAERLVHLPVNEGGVVPPIDPVGTYYPGSYPTGHDIATELAGVANSKAACTSFYLDTTEGMSDSTADDFADWVLQSHGEGEDHAQGLARTHVLSDGSIYWFLAHSETGDGEQGTITQYRYDGPRDIEHVLQTSPLTVAPMTVPPLMLDERHPSDIAFLPDVNGADAGYLFVTKEDDRHVVTVYRWAPDQQLAEQGQLPPPTPGQAPSPPPSFPANGPNFVFIDRVGERYCLGIASNNWGYGFLYWADQDKLFPSNAPGALEVAAFQLDQNAPRFPFPATMNEGPCQTKLIRDSTATSPWYLLAFRADHNDDPNGQDIVDVYPVTFEPSFAIADLCASVPISFNAGDTGFASTGTHHVELSGRLLISSSYRWSEDEGPGDSSFVSRVDECPSSMPPASPGTPGSGPIGDGRPPHQQN